MSGGVIASVITPHSPRMGVEQGAPDFVRPLIDGSRELGEWIRSLQADCLVLQSTHWVSTFNWYATAHETHQGFCVAEEAPDLIPGLPYERPGYPELAGAIAAAGSNVDIPFFTTDCNHYHWDYGCYVPLKYIDPDSGLRVVTLPTVLMADLKESMQVGRLVDAVARDRGDRVVYISSTALTHKLVRGPDKWPSDERQALDFRFIEMLEAQDVDAAIEWFPQYARESVAEMSGRVLAGFMGALDAMRSSPYKTRRFGAYGQSSGSGNMSFACSPTL